MLKEEKRTFVKVERGKVDFFSFLKQGPLHGPKSGWVTRPKWADKSLLVSYIQLSTEAQHSYGVILQAVKLMAVP